MSWLPIRSALIAMFHKIILLLLSAKYNFIITRVPDFLCSFDYVEMRVQAATRDRSGQPLPTSTIRAGQRMIGDSVCA